MKKKSNADESGGVKLFFRGFWVLKLFLILLFCYGQNLSATAESQMQRVSLALQNVKLKRVIDVLESQTRLDFFYSDREVDVESRVSVTADNESLDLVLGRVFGPGFSFEVIGDMVVVKPVISPLAEPQKLKVSGVVSDQNGTIPGVSILIKGTGEGVATDIEGKFELEVLPGAVLQFSCMGYINTGGEGE